jgi:hypothetical protein
VPHADTSGLACFYNEKVDISIDVVRLARPRTPFQLTEIAYFDTPRTGELVRMLTVVSQLPMCRRDELGTEERTACGF